MGLLPPTRRDKRYCVNPVRRPRLGLLRGPDQPRTQGPPARPRATGPRLQRHPQPRRLTQDHGIFGSGGLRDTGGRAPTVSIHRSRPPLWGRAAALWVDGSGHAGPRSVTRVPVGVHAVVLRVALRLLGKQRGPNSPQQRTEQSDPHAHGGTAGLPLGCPWDVDLTSLTKAEP